MRHPRPSRAAGLVITASLVLLVPVSDVGAKGTSRPLADYFLTFGDTASGLWRDDHAGAPPDVEDPLAQGAWWVSDARFADGILDLHVTVQPPAWTLPVEAGPAVLFTTVGLGGGFEGDIFQQRVVSIDPTGLPACTDDPCTFEADLHLDLHRLPTLARRIDDFSGTTAGIGLVLVRTFAGGTWLQLVESADRAGADWGSGRLGSPEPWTGRAPNVGLFPASTSSGWQHEGHVDRPDQRFDYAAIVESIRSTLGDDTLPVESRDVRVLATYDDCEDMATAGLETTYGDRVYLVRDGRAGDVDGIVSLPVGTTWRLGSDPSVMPLVDVGEVDLVVAGHYTCTDDAPSISGVTVNEMTGSPHPATSIASPPA